MNQSIKHSFAPGATITAAAILLATLALGSAADAKTPFSLLKCGKQEAATTNGAEENKAAETEKGVAWAHSRVLINAPAHVVWYTVHEERQHDPDLAYSKVLEQKDHETKLEQKFNLIPVIGSATCVMQQKEVLDERIDYKLLKSDHFKAMEGSWVLTPTEDGKGTYLELTTHLDMGLPVPPKMMAALTTKKIERRLAHVKTMAEKSSTEVALKGRVIQ